MRRRRIWRALPLVLWLALVAVVAGAISRGPAARSAGGSAVTSGLPDPVAPAFTPGRPRALGSTRDLSHWAPVRRAAVARASPDAAARVVAGVSTTTPEGTHNLVAVLARAHDRAGRPWVRVRLAALPGAARTGWMRRGALGGYQTVRTHLDVDLSRLRATLYRDGRAVLRAPIGAGMPGWRTPTGRFYVRNRLTRYRSPAYGPIAFGTSARSPRHTDWPAGGFVGIHGTDRPDLVPGRISHGCVRMRNADIVALARLMPVGTPLTIH